MLIDTFLPDQDFAEFHSIEVKADPATAYEKLLSARIGTDWISKMLFRIRGLPHGDETISSFGQGVFTRLGEQRGEEILFGIVSKDGFFGNCRSCTIADFLQPDPNVIRSVINFRCICTGDKVTISTETRIACGNARLKNQFRKYWFFVKPFSALIRKKILKQVRESIEGTA